MKTLTKLFIVTLLSIASARGQDVVGGVSKDTRVTTPNKEKSWPFVKEAPNQITGKKFKFRGALIQIFKADNPLQLINPFAPAGEYGSGYDNVVRDPITGNGTGISFLTIER